MTDDERPTPRVRNIPPDPSEAQDPVVPPGGTDTPPPAPVFGRRRGPQISAQLNTRVDPVLTDLVEYVSNVRGLSKRDVVEHALKTAYRAELRTLTASKEASK